MSVCVWHICYCVFVSVLKCIWGLIAHCCFWELIRGASVSVSPSDEVCLIGSRNGGLCWKASVSFSLSDSHTHTHTHTHTHKHRCTYSESRGRQDQHASFTDSLHLFWFSEKTQTQACVTIWATLLSHFHFLAYSLWLFLHCDSHTICPK